MEPRARRLDPVERAAEPGGQRLGGKVEEDGQVGHEPFRAPQRQAAHLVLAERPSRALVGGGRIDVSVRQNHRAALERGTNDGGDVVRPVRRVQQGLCPRRDVAAVQEQLADMAPELGSAGVSGCDDVEAAPAQPFGKHLHLGGLA